MKSFETWTLEDVVTTFGLTQNYESKLLSDWINVQPNIDQHSQISLERLKFTLLRNVNAWNEDELKFQFIGPIVSLVNFSTEKYKLFSQRNLSSTINGIEAEGRVDAMVAMGMQRPKEPFFFIHEYKPKKRSANNDPEGQLLIAMVAAQNNNTHEHPVYGALVDSRTWYFFVLKNNEFAISNDFSATSDDIFKIFAILCKAKEYIEMEVDKISKNK